MSWSLQIDIPQTKYKAGDTVSGSVHLISQSSQGQEVDVGSITVDFTGRSTTAKHWPRLPDSVRLFSFKKTLFNGPKRLYAPYTQSELSDRNQWPFSFSLPLNCSSYSSESVARPSYFNDDPSQPLPVSFANDNVQSGSSCSIVYEVHATLRSPLKDGYYTNDGCTDKVHILLYSPRRI